MLAPGRAVALERDVNRAKSVRHREEHGAGIVERWAYLEDDLKSELGGTGFWVGNAKLTPQQTVDVIIANKSRARLA